MALHIRYASVHNLVEQSDGEEPTSFPSSTALPLLQLSLVDNMTKSARDSATDILTPSLPLPIPSPATPTLSPSSPNLITVLPASPSDLPLLAQLQRKAFATSSVDLLIFPDVSEADHLSHWVDRMARAIDDPFKAVGKAVDAQGTTVGMALWETPKRAEHKGNKEERKWPFGPNLELAEELFSQRRDPEASGVSQYRASFLCESIQYARSTARRPFSLFSLCRSLSPCRRSCTAAKGCWTSVDEVGMSEGGRRGGDHDAERDTRCASSAFLPFLTPSKLF